MRVSPWLPMSFLRTSMTFLKLSWSNWEFEKRYKQKKQAKDGQINVAINTDRNYPFHFVHTQIHLIVVRLARKTYHLPNGLIHVVSNWRNDFQSICIVCWKCMINTGGQREKMQSHWSRRHAWKQLDSCCIWQQFPRQVCSKILDKMLVVKKCSFSNFCVIRAFLDYLKFCLKFCCALGVQITWPSSGHGGKTAAIWASIVPRLHLVWTCISMGHVLTFTCGSVRRIIREMVDIICTQTQVVHNHIVQKVTWPSHDRHIMVIWLCMRVQQQSCDVTWPSHDCHMTSHLTAVACIWVSSALFPACSQQEAG